RPVNRIGRPGEPPPGAGLRHAVRAPDARGDAGAQHPPAPGPPRPDRRRRPRGRRARHPNPHRRDLNRGTHHQEQLVTRLSQLAVSKRSVTLLLAAALFVAGILAWGSLKQELLPDSAVPIVTALAPHPRAGAADVTAQAAAPLQL